MLDGIEPMSKNVSSHFSSYFFPSAKWGSLGTKAFTIVKIFCSLVTEIYLWAYTIQGSLLF